MRFEHDLLFYKDGEGNDQWIMFIGEITAIKPSEVMDACAVDTVVGSYWVTDLKAPSLTRVTPINGAPPNRWDLWDLLPE